MRNFYRLAQNLDTTHLTTILHQTDVWNQINTRREIEDSPHIAVDDIILRGDVGPQGEFWDHRECDNTKYWDMFPAANLIFSLMATVQGTRLGRCMITRLAPGEVITAHKDICPDYHYDKNKYYSRYHIVLQAGNGSIFKSGEEQVQMLTGECWWFDNRQDHLVINNSRDDRIHLIIDIK
jgi:hypothetical protein